jgi:hypothetical protein
MFVDLDLPEPLSASSSPHHRHAMAAIDSAISGEDVEVVLNRLSARLDARDAQRRTAEAEADRAAARRTPAAALPGPISAPQAPVPATPKPTLPADRGAAIDALVLPGTEHLAATLKADTTITIEAASQQILAAYKRARGLGVTVASSPVATVPQAPEGWRTEFAASAELRSEFDSAETYANWRAAQASGRVRILAPSPGPISSGGSR